ncbi:hypothetical protein AgCh_016826 [Apium graveolens]
MKDYSPEDISSIMKNVKVRHILHNGLDNVTSNRVIGCKITKEIWDALEVKCQVALKVEEKPKEKARRKSYSKGKAMIAKSDIESSNCDDDSNTDTESDTDSDHNNNEDMDQMVALLVKSFKKMVYKNFRKGRRFSRKGSSSSNSDKRNNGRNTDGKESRFGKFDKSKERCYNCDGIGHFAADCRKPRAEKKQALISRKRNWDDSSDSYAGVNYALMAKADAEDDNAELKGDRRNALVFDSGCLGHMTGKILGYGKIKVENVIIENVTLVAGLKHNLISVSQISYRGYHVNFYKENCEIVSKFDGKITLTGVRHGSLYEARVSTSIDNSKVYLLSRASVEDAWNWHKILPHLNFNNINELVRKDLVRGLPNAVFTPDGLCDSC